MKTYNTQEEVEKDIVDGVLAIDDDVTFNCNISIDANINAGDIDARNINAGDIKARDIDAGDISYYAYCIAYKNIFCASHKGRMDNHLPPISIDGDVIVREQQDES